MSFFNGFWDLLDLLGFNRDKSAEQEAIQRELSGETNYGEGIAINKERLSRGNTGRGYNPFDITGGSSQEDMDGAGLTSGLPNLLGALASYFNAMTGADLTNAQKAQNQFNAQQAELQRDWETQMSNTAYQRVVADMQSGGINPAMAWSNGAASTPSGASASAGSAMNGLDTLSTLLQLRIQNKLADASVHKLDAETSKTVAETSQIEKTTSWIDPLNELVVSEKQANIDYVKSNTDLNREQIENVTKLREQIDADIKLKLAQTKTEGEKAALTAAQVLFTKAEEWQIYKLTPYLNELYHANAYLSMREAYNYSLNNRQLEKFLRDGYFDDVIESMEQTVKGQQLDNYWNEFTAMPEGKGFDAGVAHAMRVLGPAAGAAVTAGVGAVGFGVGKVSTPSAKPIRGFR